MSKTYYAIKGDAYFNGSGLNLSLTAHYTVILSIDFGANDEYGDEIEEVAIFNSFPGRIEEQELFGKKCIVHNYKLLKEKDALMELALEFIRIDYERLIYRKKEKLHKLNAKIQSAVDALINNNDKNGEIDLEEYFCKEPEFCKVSL